MRAMGTADMIKEAPSGPRRQLVREELLTKAAEVFERRGYGQARIQDVAEALQLSRSALYHYFRSKEEILAALVEEHTGARFDALRALAEDKQRPASERLREALRKTIASRLSEGSRMRVLDQLAAEMPADLRKTFDKGRRRVLNYYAAIIEDGIAAGDFRPMDARTAALAVIGIASWTSWWYSPAGRKTPAELGDALIDIALHGLVETKGATPQDRQSLIAAMERTLGDLKRLEGR